MSLITLLLFLLLIFYLGGFLLRQFGPRLAMWLLKRKMRNAFGENDNQQQRYSRQNNRNKTAQKQHAKKIGRDVGEYIDFEEVRVYTDSKDNHGSATTKVEVEQQITDVEWEDVK